MLPLSVNFDALDIILVIGVSQGLFLALTLGLIHNRNMTANSALIKALLIAVLMLFGRVLIGVLQLREPWILRLGSLADATLFLFGPYLYTYVRRLCIRESPTFRLAWWHFLPCGIYLLYFCWTLTISLVDFSLMTKGFALNLWFFFVEMGGILSFAYYLTRSWFILFSFRKMKPNQLSFDQSVERFLLFFLCSLTVLNLLWLISFVSIFGFGTFLPGLNYNSMWLIIPVFIYIIGYFSLSQPEIFRIQLPIEEADFQLSDHTKQQDQKNIPVHGKEEKHPTTVVKKEKDRLSMEKINRLNKRLDYFMTQENVYRQADLTLAGLAEKLNSSANDLSWLLNQTHKTTFYEFINRHRVEDFITRIDRGDHERFTFLSMAYEVGFNSKSTFNKVFKAQTGLTPSQYIKNKHVA